MADRRFLKPVVAVFAWNRGRLSFGGHGCTSLGKVRVAAQNYSSSEDLRVVLSAEVLRRDCGRLAKHQLIPRPLMRLTRVVVLDLLPHQIVEVLLAEYLDVIEALDVQGLNEPLHVGVGIGPGYASLMISTLVALHVPSNALPTIRLSSGVGLPDRP